MNYNSEIIHITITALLAMFGSLARLLSKKDTMAVKISHMLSGCFTSAFAGVLTHFISLYANLEPNIAFVIAGVAGWTSPQILDAMASMVSKLTGLQLNKPTDKDKNQNK